MVAINSSDTGSGLDGPGLDAYGSGYYSGALYGDYTYIRVVATGLSDSGSGVDAGSQTSGVPHVSSSDSGQGVESGSIPTMVARASSDSGHLVEIAVATTPPGAYPMDFDLGLGLDADSLVGHPHETDFAHPIESPVSVASPSNSTHPLNRDMGSGVETYSVNKVVTSSDSGKGVDAGSVLCGIALVQSNSVNSGGTLETSQAVTLSGGIALGNLIVACVGDGSDDEVISGPPGFTQAVINSPTGTVETSLWYMVVTPATAGQTSWTFTSAVLVSMAVSISEYNSIYGWLPFPLDQIAQGNTKPNTSSSSTVDSGTTPLTTQLCELCVASLAYGGQQGFTTENTDFNPVEQTEGSFVSLAELFLMVDTLTSADCNIDIGAPYAWAGCMATFMPVMSRFVVSSDAGQGADSAGEELTGTITYVYSSDSETSTGTDSVVSAAVPSSLFLEDFDIGRGYDGSPSYYGRGLYGNLIYSPNATVPVVTLPTGAGAHTGMSDYAIGQEKQSVKIHGSGSQGEFPVVSPATFQSIFEGFSLSRAGVLGPGGTESAQLYAAQTITLAPNVTTTDMKSDDWDIGAWYFMDKAALTVTNGFMSWATLSTLAGTTISSSGMSPHDYYGMPLWTQYQHNQPAVSMAFRMAAKNGISGQRTLDFLLYRVQLSMLDYTGLAYKQGLVVSYTGTVLFSQTDEVGATLVDPYGFPAPQVGRFVSSPGNQVGAFTKAYA